MLSFLADENFNGDVVRGLLRRQGDLDIVTVQEVGLSGEADPDVPERAAAHGRIVVTHAINTMAGFAMDRVTAGLAMPGVVEVADHLPIGSVIEDLPLLAECSLEGEWENRTA